MAKETAKILERTYNIPLRKEFLKVPRWNRSHKAVTALRQFLAHHLKSEDIKIGTSINQTVWARGAQHPPHHVKVNVTKNEKGEVRAELFGAKAKVARETKKKVVKTEAVAETAKVSPSS